MPTAYTPGLKITEDTLIKKERRLPIKGEVLVKPGDATTPETVVARAMLEGNLQTFKAADKLGVSPDELTGLLKKEVGDTVERDELLAEVKGLFGLFHSELKAPTSGTIEHISATSGFIGIREPAKPIETNAYMSGAVTGILEGDGAIIQARGAFVQGIFGVGGERYGPIRMATGKVDEALTVENITDDMKGAVLVCGEGVITEALAKARQVGISGLVTGSVPDEILRAYVGYDIGVAITGQEKVPFTLILTEGFGTIPMAQRTFRLLQSLEGKVASINGATQIRAGVIRPEIIVPRQDGAVISEAGAVKQTQSDQLAVGVKVRIIREPYFGKQAEVVALPPDLQTIETGAKVRVSSVKLEDGSKATIPRANLEIIQQD